MSIDLVRRIHQRAHGATGPFARPQCRAFAALGAVALVTGASLSTAVPATAGASLAFAWGYNHNGELGNGTNTDTNLPVAVKGLTGVTAISAGSHHCLALLSSGKVKAWGDNFYGELGTGTGTSSNLPVAVKGLAGVKAVSAGFEHGLARK
jgi:alpha-tubulin suppressor-like RCC1 family protein